MSESSDSTDVGSGSTMKTSLRRSSTSNAMAVAGPSQAAVTNGTSEVTTKKGIPALRQRSASLGKVCESEGSKRKRDPSPLNDPASSPEPLKSEGVDMSSDVSCAETPIPSSDAGPVAKRRKSLKNDNNLPNDIYCWVCHKEFITGQPISYCKTCPRSYHTRCIPNMEDADFASSSEDLWQCPECRIIDRAENVQYRSQSMQLLSLDQLCTLLKFSLGRMKAVIGAEPFLKPVDPTEFPSYSEYIVNVMDMSQLEKNVRRKQYGSTEAFLADTKWIHHNSVIFNTFQAKLTSAARSIVKVCRQEMAEIENCPDCYLNAHTRKESWFIEVCRRPHMLVWAKLKGFPFWPAKAMKVNKESAVDVRFFGAHDRAWVPVRDCYLYSREMPSGMKQKKRNNLEACISEVEQHVLRLKERFGAFCHAPPRTAFDPDQQEKQLNMLLPNYQPGVDGKRARTVLHPEISSSSRTPGKAVTPGSAHSTMAKESVPSNEKLTTTTPTTLRSGRSSSTSQKKSMYPVVTMLKQETADVAKHTDNEIESSHDDEDGPEHSNLDESVESINEENMVVRESDTKLAEEQAISAIIRTSKAMEETLGLPATQSDPNDSKSSELDEEIHEEPEDQNEDEEGEEKENDEQGNLESPDRSNNSSPLSHLRTSPSPVPDLEDETSNHSLKKETENDALKSLVNVSITKIPSKPKVSKTDDVVLADSTESIVEQNNSQSSETHTEPDIESVKNESEEEKDENIASDTELEGVSPKKIDELSDVNSASSTMRSEPASDTVMSAGEEEDEESDHPDEEDAVLNKTDSKDPIVPKISIQVLKCVRTNKEEDSKKTASDVPSVTITAENCPSNDTSSEKKITRLNEVQITPIEKVKRKLPDTSSNSISSDLSSDSESEHVSELKKKKTEGSKKIAQKENEEVNMEVENPQNSPRPSNTDDDSIFPSLFLDPSVTITVVENTNEKKSTSGDVTAQELCASVKLSSDVSLTIVEKSKSSDKQSHSSSPSPAPSTTSEVSSTSKKPLPPLKGKSKARKSFAPPPKQLISVRNPSTLLANGNKSPPTTEQQNAASAVQKELLANAIQGAREARQSNMMSGPNTNIPLPPPNTHRPPNHRSGPPQLPQLQPRPFSGHFPPGPPSEAGPATSELNKHAGKLTEYVRQSLETLIRDLASLGSPQASLGAMQLEMERVNWRHQQEMAELKHNADLVVLEMRASMESERARALAELRRQSEIEKQRAIEETKKKQWCAYCNKEALFYCCWNTSYCDYPCQQAHWPRHMATCAQKYSKDGSSNNPNPSHPPHGPNAPKAAYHGTTQNETTERASPWLPEREEIPSPPQKSSKWSGKRKRCGQCDGCAVTQNCGMCAPCKNSRTHQVCRERRCHTLEESERQRWLASQPLLSNIKKNHKPKGLPPNVQLTQQQLVNMGAPGMPGNRPPQHFAIVPRPMQGGGMPQFAMYPAGGSPRAPMGSQTSHVAFPMQPHFFM